MPGRRWFIAGLATLLALALTLGTVSAAPAAQQCGSNYVVQYGDDLYQISLRSGVSMDAIAHANHLWNYNVLYAGQTLFIPCGYGNNNYQPQYVAPPQQQYHPPVYTQPYNPNPGQHHYNGAAPYYTNVWLPPGQYNAGQPYYPQYGQPPQYPQQPSQPTGYCGGITPTSPLGGLAHGGNTFYWNPTYGVTSYRVNVFGVDANPGALVASFNTGGTETSVSGDLGGVPGYQLAWEVQGLLNGNVVCSSPRYTMGHATH